MNSSVELSKFSNSNYYHGKSLIIRLIWILFSTLIFRSSIPYSSRLKVLILRLFGSEIGKGVVIRTNVNIKHPWLLKIGDFVWIGEEVWIDNLVMINIGDNVCISQGAMLLTGNHNYTKTSFDLITGEIRLENGVWIGAKSIVGPGVTCCSHSILAVGSATFKNLDADSIYQGNPAKFKRKRIID
jgi:putative colanic acid biosynthesis acetyltransferase WcaF